MDNAKIAPRPPMGWNSYDYYDTTVTEEDVRKNALFMAENLREFGWEYVVVDIQWYAHRPNARRDKYQYIPFGELNLDEYSRLIPDPERFPSSADGAGFKPLADFVHSLGLKFGIHIMRGIPRLAAHRHMRVLGTEATADEIADPSDVCRWNPDMHGVRPTEAGQAYYDSIAALYASWGVDFIKCDDICNTDNQAPVPTERSRAGRAEMRMLRCAIDKCGRDMVLSLSPGPALLDMAEEYAACANMWRITDDFWDKWEPVREMFARCRLWQGHTRAGAYPDCDMLPFGVLGGGFGQERRSNLTEDEQRTVMTLWCVFGSPLMLGAELTKLAPRTMSLLTNREVLSLLDPANTRRELEGGKERIIWELETPDKRWYLAVFNLTGAPRRISCPAGSVDVWTGEAPTGVIPPHGVALLRVE